MREILFRGKRTDNGELIVGQLLRYEDGRARICESHTDIFCYKNDQSIIQTVAHEVCPDTIGQFTGLTDKNGKKIFEGDIIKSDNGKQSAVSVVCYGEFSPRMFYDLLENFVMQRPKEKIVGLFLKSTGEEMLLSNNSKLIEVIGNIHDNPELLKEE